MKLIIKLFGILIIVSGILLLIKPIIILGWIEGNVVNISLYISAIIVRLVIGILLIKTVKESKYPGIIKFFGYLFVLAALILIVIGHGTFQHFITSLIPNVNPFAPVIGLLSIAFGGFLIYSFLIQKELEEK